MTRTETKYIHEGSYVAEVDVDLLEDDTGWSPYLSVQDAYKLDAVRATLSRGDVRRATQDACILTMTPVDA